MLKLKGKKHDKEKYKNILFISMINLLDIHIEKDVVQIPFTFDKLGYKVYYIMNSVSLRERKKLDNINIIELKNLNFIKVISTIISTFKKVRPRVVFMYPLWRYQLFVNLILIVYKKILHENFSIVIKLDSDGNLKSIPHNTFLIKIFLFFAINTSDITIIESNNAKARLLSYYNTLFRRFLTDKIYVMYNGLSEELIRKYRDYSRQYIRFNKILVNTRVIEDKGLLELILAIYNIRDKIDDWKVHIVGPVEDKLYFEKLKSTIDNLNLNDKIVFLGELHYEDLIKEYVTSKIFILPSKREGFSIARLNAMAACLPIISTDTGGAEIIKDCCGIIIPVNDVVTLSNAILELINDQQLREKYSKNACEKIKEFSWEKLISTLLIKLNHGLNE